MPSGEKKSGRKKSDDAVSWRMLQQWVADEDVIERQRRHDCAGYCNVCAANPGLEDARLRCEIDTSLLVLNSHNERR